MRLSSVIVVALAGVLGWLAWQHYPARSHDNTAARLHTAPARGQLEHSTEVIPGPALGSAPAGEELEITLFGPPARLYAAGEDSGSDADYRDIVAALAADLSAELGNIEVRYDPALSRAAREVAYQTGALGFAPPEAVMSFLLHAAGAPELSAVHFSTHTTSEAPEVLRETVRRAMLEAPDGAGPLRIGVGEVATPASTYTRHLSVLATRRAYEIEPAPRLVAPGGEWVLRGRLPEDYHDPEVSVLHPDGRIGGAEIAVTGRRFEVTVRAGHVPGTMHVGVSGVDERGPGKLLQLSVEVGRELPASTRVTVPDDDGAFADIEDAEAHALALLDSDRERFDRPPLIADPALTAIARAHSRDMRDNEFFGHLSPATGLLADRLARAGYRASAFAENLARNDSLGEAQASLMASVGHRRNILAPRFTHVGVGLARRDDGERVEWFVTQVFAVPVRELDPVRARTELLERINAARDAATVVLDPALSAIAQGHARAVAGGAFEGVAQRVVADLAGFDRAMNVSVGAVYDLSALELPDAALAADVSSIGIGVAQSAGDVQGRVGVIIISARDTPP